MSETAAASITALAPGAHLLPAVTWSEQISDFDLSAPTRGSASVLDWDLDLELPPRRPVVAGAGIIPA